MIVSDIAELLLYPVVDRGMPNSERIPLLVREQTDMGRYGLMVGYTGQNGFAMPFRDNLFWFGDGLVNQGDWIFIFTGEGTPRTDNWDNPPGSKIYTVHWGRPQTMFATSIVVPVLFRTDFVQVGQPQVDQPQIGKITY